MGKRCRICVSVKNFTFLLLASNILLTVFLTYFLTILWIYRTEYNDKIRSNDLTTLKTLSKLKFSSFQSSSLFNFLQIFQDFHENHTFTNESSIQNLTSLWSYNLTNPLSSDSWATLKNLSSLVESLSLFSPIFLSLYNNTFQISHSLPPSISPLEFPPAQDPSKPTKFMTQVRSENSLTTQLICLNSSQILICYLACPTYPPNTIVSQSYSTVWHANLKPTVAESEFPEDYFLSAAEKSEFIKEFLTTSVQGGSFEYLQKGEKKVLTCFAYLDTYSYCVKTEAVNGVFLYWSSALNVSLFFSLFFTVLIVYSLTLYLAYRVYQSIHHRFLQEIDYLAHCLNYEPNSTELKQVQLLIKHVKLLKTFKNPVSRNYSEQLLEYCQEILVFQQGNNWKAVCKLLKKIAELQFFNDFNAEALKNLATFVKTSKQHAGQVRKGKILLLEIFLDLFYEGNKECIKDALRICQGVNSVNQHFSLLSIVVLAYNGLVEEAENEFLGLHPAADPELKDFVAGVLLKHRSLYKKAAKTFFFTLSLQKYYNPKVRKWVKAELQSLFLGEDIGKVLNNEEFFNEIVILCENSLEVDEGFLEVYKKFIPKVLKVLQRNDLVSVYLFGKGVRQLCPLVCVRGYRRIVKSCLGKIRTLGTRPKMLKCLNQAVQELSTHHPPSNTLDWLSPEPPKKAHKLIILLSTGCDYSNPTKPLPCLPLLNTHRISLLILAMNPTPSNTLHIQSLQSSIKSCKTVFANSPQDLKKSILRIKSLFI